MRPPIRKIDGNVLGQHGTQFSPIELCFQDIQWNKKSKAFADEFHEKFHLFIALISNKPINVTPTVLQFWFE